MSLNGIDISNWNGMSGFSPRFVDCDFVIAKATQGVYYKDKWFKQFMDEALDSGKLIGAYHFASTKSSPEDQADFFCEKVGNYLGSAILCLDWENDDQYDPGVLASGPDFAKALLDAIKARSGVTPFIYMSKSVTNEWNWKKVAKEYPLWCAQYPNYDAVHGFLSKPWTDSSAFGAWGAEPSIFQYTSELYLPVWNLRLDGNIAYMTSGAWDMWATPGNWWNDKGKEDGKDGNGGNGSKLVVDGLWGELTTAALQRYFGIEPSGIIEHQWPSNKQGAFTSGWMYDRSGIGDELIKRMQVELGVYEDGLIGPHTINFLQNRMGTPVDGELWAYSPCVKAMQEKLNRGEF